MTVLDPPFLKKRVAVGVNSSLWGGFPLVSVKAIEIQSSEKRTQKQASLIAETQELKLDPTKEWMRWMEKNEIACLSQREEREMGIPLR